MINTSVERNDIDISRLFGWRKEFSIIDKEGKELQRVWIRVAGDADVNQARVYALRKSAELRKKLKQEDSDERLAYIPDREAMDRPNIIESLLLFTALENQSDAYKNVKVDEPKEPSSEATLEEQENFQKEVDAYPEKVQQAVKAYIEIETAKKREEYKKLKTDVLCDELEKVIINQQCVNEMYYRFKMICVFKGVYGDNEYKTRLFNSFEEFDNLPTEIKEQFVNNYNSLERSTEELKN